MIAFVIRFRKPNVMNHQNANLATALGPCVCWNIFFKTFCVGDFIPEFGKAGNDRREFVAEGYKTAFQAAVRVLECFFKTFCVGDFIPEQGKAGNDRREFVAEGYKPAFQAGNKLLTAPLVGTLFTGALAFYWVWSTK